MTENEAKEILLQIAYDGEYPIGSSEAFSIAIQALEEIQQYRAMEEKLNGISVEQVVNGFINTVENQTEEPYERGRILTNSDVDMWNEYRAIGTIEEFKALKEKSVAKKAEVNEFDYGEGYVCGECESFLHYVDDDDEHIRTNYCCHCGTKIDWQ